MVHSMAAEHAYILVLQVIFEQVSQMKHILGNMRMFVIVDHTN